MTIRRSLALAALLPALTAAASPAPAAAGRAKPSCAATKSVTLKSTRSVRVYRQGRNLLACLRRSGRDVELYETGRDANPYVETGFSDVKVRGTVVAWETRYVESQCTDPSVCLPGGREDTVEAADIGTRRNTSRSVLVNAKPSAYAITTSGGIVALAGTTLVGSDGRGRRQRVLDSGAIDAASLRAEISVVSWTRDGVERFARVR